MRARIGAQVGINLLIDVNFPFNPPFPTIGELWSIGCTALKAARAFRGGNGLPSAAFALTASHACVHLARFDRDVPLG